MYDWATLATRNVCEGGRQCAFRSGEKGEKDKTNVTGLTQQVTLN